VSLTHDDVSKILAIVDQLGDREVRIEFGDLKIHISRDRPARSQPAAAPIAAPAPDAPPPAAPKAEAAEVPIPPGMIAIRAPMVGTFYRSPSPGAPPFVQTGQAVGPDDTLCLLEVMKLFNSVKAGVAGNVAAILPENGALVRQDQLLLLIEPR